LSFERNPFLKKNG
ncbi:hypothetical protein D046_7385, partial [Vibrio parahaemolyticus V-223/04]